MPPATKQLKKKTDRNTIPALISDGVADLFAGALPLVVNQGFHRQFEIRIRPSVAGEWNGKC